VTAAAFNSSGSLLATGDSNGLVVITDMSLGQKVGEVSVNAGGVEFIVFSPDGALMAANSESPMAGAVSLFETTDWSEVGQVEPGGENPVDIFFTADSRYLVIATWFEGFGNIELVDTTSGESVDSFREDNDPLLTADSSPEELIAGGSSDGIIRFFSVITRSATGDPLEDHRVDACELSLENCGSVRRLRFSPDGSVLVSGDRTGVVFVWDVGNRSLEDRLDGHGSDIIAIDIAHVGAQFTIVVSDENKTTIWEGTSG
jgi:WD40 repeat protein